MGLANHRSIWNATLSSRVPGKLSTRQNLEILSGVVLGGDSEIMAIEAILVAVADNQSRFAGITVQGNVVSHEAVPKTVFRHSFGSSSSGGCPDFLRLRFSRLMSSASMSRPARFRASVRRCLYWRSVSSKVSGGVRSSHDQRTSGKSSIHWRRRFLVFSAGVKIPRCLKSSSE